MSIISTFAEAEEQAESTFYTVLHSVRDILKTEDSTKDSPVQFLGQRESLNLKKDLGDAGVQRRTLINGIFRTGAYDYLFNTNLGVEKGRVLVGYDDVRKLFGPKAGEYPIFMYPNSDQDHDPDSTCFYFFPMGEDVESDEKRAKDTLDMCVSTGNEHLYTTYPSFIVSGLYQQWFYRPRGGRTRTLGHALGVTSAGNHEGKDGWEMAMERAFLLEVQDAVAHAEEIASIQRNGVASRRNKRPTVTAKYMDFMKGSEDYVDAVWAMLNQIQINEMTVQSDPETRAWLRSIVGRLRDEAKQLAWDLETMANTIRYRSQALGHAYILARRAAQLLPSQYDVWKMAMCMLENHRQGTRDAVIPELLQGFHEIRINSIFGQPFDKV